MNRGQRTERPASPEPHQDVAARLAAAMSYLKRHWAEVPTLRQAAAVARLSPFHFHRLFSARYGRTPKDVITRLQIAAAMRMLRRGVAPRDVADRCGFRHQSHLTSRFKQLVGQPPAEWASQQSSQRNTSND